MLTLILIVCAVITVYSVRNLLRNEKVYTYRTTLIDRIGSQNMEDIKAGVAYEDTNWRWDEFHNVSYAKMLYSFGKVESFFPRDPARTER